MVATINTDAFVIGTPLVYYRDVDSEGPPTGVGAIMGEVTLGVDTTWADEPDLAGVRGPVIGLKYMSRRVARISFTLAEVAGSGFAVAVPGSTTTTRATTATGGGLSTTLAADAAVGAQNIRVAAVTGLVAGEYVKIGVTADAEYRQIHTVGTLGAGGTGLSFLLPLRVAQLSGVAVVETVGDGATVISASNVRRLPTSAYKDWILVQQVPNGYLSWFIDNAVAVAASADMTFGNNTWAGLPVTLEASFPETDLETEPWRFELTAVA